jgi:hypothetical protein
MLRSILRHRWLLLLLLIPVIAYAADTKISGLSEVSVPLLTHELVINAAGTSNKLTAQRFLGQMFPGAAGGRLTTESGVAISTADRTAQGTLYYTPYAASPWVSRVSLYDGTRWRLYSFSEVSLTLTLTDAKNYDVFLYDAAGTLTLELSAAWTTDSTRADALTTQDGVTVKSGATTRRWVGTIRASGTNTTEDSTAKRLVWNVANRVPRRLSKSSTSGHTYNSASYRAWNNDTANRVALVQGEAGSSLLMAITGGLTPGATSNIPVLGFTLNGTGTGDALFLQISAGNGTQIRAAATLSYTPSLGYSFWQAVEASLSATTDTFDNFFLDAVVSI